MSAEHWPPPPPGRFRRHLADGRALYVAEPDSAAAIAQGLDDPATWKRLIVGGDSATGRGASAVVPQDAGPSWRLKQLKRGGWAARLLGDRYGSAERLLDVLAASGEAERRGVPTARAVALLLEQAGGFVRGFLATQEIDGAEDLARRAARGAGSEDDLRAVLATVRRMHDRGMDHPDLNLGNLLVAPGPSGSHAFVIDLDKVAFGAGAVPVSRRRRALRRLERSCAKRTGCSGYLGEGSEDLWYDLYADRDASLARALARGRPFRRWSIALHRLGWPGGLR